MFLNKGISIILSMLYVPLFLSCLDSTRYGIWIAIMSIVNWIGFFDIGIGQGVRNLLSESLAKEETKTAKRIVSTAYIAISFIFILILTIILLTTKDMDLYKLVNAPINIGQEINTIILIACGLVSINFILSLFKSVAFAYQKPQISSNIALYTQSSSLLIIYIFYKFGQITSLIPIGTILLATPVIILLLYSIYYFKNEFKEVSPSFKYFDRKIIKKVMLLGSGFFFIQITNLIIFQSNSIIITNLVSPEAVSEYFVINKYFSLLFFAFSILTTPFWSAATEAYTKQDFNWIRSAKNKLIKTYVLFIAVTGLLFLFSPLFFKIWIGDKINISTTLSALIACYILVQMFTNIYLSFINGIGKIKLQLITTIIQVIIYIPTVIFAGNKFGIHGIITAGILINIIPCFIYPIQFKKLITSGKKAHSIWYE